MRVRRFAAYKESKQECNKVVCSDRVAKERGGVEGFCNNLQQSEGASEGPDPSQFFMLYMLYKIMFILPKN